MRWWEWKEEDFEFGFSLLFFAFPLAIFLHVLLKVIDLLFGLNW